MERGSGGGKSAARDKLKGRAGGSKKRRGSFGRRKTKRMRSLHVKYETRVYVRMGERVRSEVGGVISSIVIFVGDINY